MRAGLAALIAVALVAAACTSGDESSPQAVGPGAVAGGSTAAPATSAPTQAPSPDPFAIPDDQVGFTQEYLERVLEQLTLSIPQAVRIAQREGDVTPAVQRVLRQTHTARGRRGVLSALRRAVAAEPPVLARNPRRPTVQVRRIVSADARCVFVLVRQNLGILRGGGTFFRSYYHLVARNRDHTELNPSDWLINGSKQPLRDERFPSPCP